jgi:hypothetical protein
VADTNIVQRFATPRRRYLLSTGSQRPTRDSKAELDIYDDTGEGYDGGKDPQQEGQAYALRVCEYDGCGVKDTSSCPTPPGQSELAVTRPRG